MVYVGSILLAGLSVTFSFIWREHVLIRFQWTKLNVVFTSVHYLSWATACIGLFPMFSRALADITLYKNFLDKVRALDSKQLLRQLSKVYVEQYGGPYVCSYAIWCVLHAKWLEFSDFCMYSLLPTVFCFSLVIKAVYRVRLRQTGILQVTDKKGNWTAKPCHESENYSASPYAFEGADIPDFGTGNTFRHSNEYHHRSIFQRTAPQVF